MNAFAATEQRDELVRLARHSDTFPGAALSPVLALSTLPRVETAETFDRLRAALRADDGNAAQRALDRLSPRPLVTRDVLAVQWERLAHWYLNGPIDDTPVWAAVDALAPHLSEQDRTLWFEQLYGAIQVRDGDLDLSTLPPDERDPDAVERTAREAVDEAIDHLIGGA